MTNKEMIAAWAAEDEAEAVRRAARDAYYAFLASDDQENIDQENALEGAEYNTTEYWTLMLASARMRAAEKPAIKFQVVVRSAKTGSYPIGEYATLEEARASQDRCLNDSPFADGIDYSVWVEDLDGNGW